MHTFPWVDVITGGYPTYNEAPRYVIFPVISISFVRPHRVHTSSM